MGELNELLKTLLLYGIVTGFLPILLIVLVVGLVSGLLEWLSGLFSYSPVPVSEPVVSSKRGVSRAEFFEEQDDDE